MFRIFFSYIFSIQLNSFFILGIEHVDITKEADSSTFFFIPKNLYSDIQTSEIYNDFKFLQLY